ncbi:hypothetical protein [Caulobacter phage Cr30]|uniref:hypothetical protein n=1 Tax=Caulobacter phage Cr30 TaxID=1357714 RepID=UPI0004A9B6D8|nr:hypothetical protein OZ74_gp198 [Caulobacter phage Cr30]AGS81145.1 hypothetical protein [Caulobacter phage Cr30]
MKLNIIDDVSVTDYPKDAPHLGGHMNETHADEGALKYMWDNWGARSMIDIGCGPDGHTKLARELGWEVLAVDGDYESPKVIDDVVIHDFSKGPAPGLPGNVFDVAWACEVLEHIWPIYAPNYMELFKNARYAVFTMAEPGQPGHHHVNCRTPEYWVDVFTFYGFEVDIEETNKIREASTMTARYMRQQGVVFRNTRFHGYKGEYL